jgi:hypothetical protein
VQFVDFSDGSFNLLGGQGHGILGGQGHARHRPPPLPPPPKRKRRARK